jgi:hypothetical protein
MVCFASSKRKAFHAIFAPEHPYAGARSGIHIQFRDRWSQRPRRRWQEPGQPRRPNLQSASSHSRHAEDSRPDRPLDDRAWRAQQSASCQSVGSQLHTIALRRVQRIADGWTPRSWPFRASLRQRNLRGSNRLCLLPRSAPSDRTDRRRSLARRQLSPSSQPTRAGNPRWRARLQIYRARLHRAIC